MVIKNAFIHFISTKKTLRQNPQSLDFIELMAERVGFEPTVPVKGHLISSSIRRYLPCTSEYLLVLVFQGFRALQSCASVGKYHCVPRCDNKFSPHLLPTLLPTVCQTLQLHRVFLKFKFAIKGFLSSFHFAPSN